MKTFVLLLTIWHTDTHVPDVYVMDYGLTGEDCIDAMFAFENIEDTGVGTLSCEFDNGE